MRFTLTAAAMLAAATALPAVAQDEPVTAETVIATVNGQEITMGHMIIIKAGLPEEYQRMSDDVLYDGILQQIVQQEVLSQDDSARETRRVRLALDNERRTLLASEVVDGVADTALTEDALEAEYEERYLKAEAEREYNASHILVETEEEARAVIEEIEAGADFASVARDKSTGPSGPNGGMLGWFGPGMMVPSFQQAVEAMEVGALSEPVQTQFGWHVITLNETRITEAPPLDEVRDELGVALQRSAVEAYIDARVAEADVTLVDRDEIDISQIGNLELLED